MQTQRRPNSRFGGGNPKTTGATTTKRLPLLAPQHTTNTTPTISHPLQRRESRIERMSAQATFRIMKELKEFHEHPDTNLYVLFSSGRYFWLTGYKGSLRRSKRD